MYDIFEIEIEQKIKLNREQMCSVLRREYFEIYDNGHDTKIFNDVITSIIKNIQNEIRESLEDGMEEFLCQ